MPSATNDIVRVVMRGRLYEQDAFNVFHFKDMGGNHAIEDLPAQFIDEVIGAPTGDPFNIGYKCESCTVQVIFPTVGPLNYETGTFYTGTGNEDAAPQLCAVTSWLTALGGRSHRGRTYWPFNGAGMYYHGLLTAPGKALVDAIGAAMLAKYGPAGTHAANFVFGIFSRKLQEFTPVTGYRTRLESKVQRRRGIGVGS